MTRAAILLHGYSVTQIWRDTWYERYQAVYALLLTAALYRHHYRCHLDPDFWKGVRTNGEANILDESLFASIGSPLWRAGCRYTAPLVIEHALATHDQIHLFGFDLSTQPSVHGHQYTQDRWENELPWYRKVWDSSRILSFGDRAEP